MFWLSFADEEVTFRIFRGSFRSDRRQAVRRIIVRSDHFTRIAECLGVSRYGLKRKLWVVHFDSSSEAFWCICIGDASVYLCSSVVIRRFGLVAQFWMTGAR